MATTLARPMSVKLDQETRDRLDRLAAERRRTPHWILREEVTQYIDREEKRERFRESTLKAWDDYQRTGLHVTAQEADAWLAELEAGNDVEPPEGTVAPGHALAWRARRGRAGTAPPQNATLTA